MSDYRKKAQKLLINILILAGVVAIIFGVTSLMASRTPIPPKTINNVVRIFMHSPLHYSVMIQEPETKIISPLNLGDYNIQELEVNFLPDVPNTEKMSVTITYGGRSGRDAIKYDFHIHSINDLGGAGWDEGKFGRGQTSVIQ